jgi:phosphate:Na+ symporter
MISTVLNILGSLGVFLFGMKVMSEGIQKTAGSRLRNILSYMTQNRVAGVF